MNMDRMQRTVKACALVLLAAAQASAYCPTPLTLQGPPTLAARSSFLAQCPFLPSGSANAGVNVQRQVPSLPSPSNRIRLLEVQPGGQMRTLPSPPLECLQVHVGIPLPDDDRAQRHVAARIHHVSGE